MIFPDRAPSAAAVADHYDELDLAYRHIWGEHVHHGYWETGRESPGEAADALVGLVAQRLAPRRGQELCDIGCGYGATGAHLAEQFGARVTGFTLSTAQARVAQARRVPGFQCVRCDWLDNGLADESFDHAYAIESSEHMVDKPRFFSEAWRVLRPGGRLVICAWLEGDNPRPWETRHLLEKICSEGQLPSMGSRADYEGLAASAGFALRGFDDISRNVRRTWSICMRRIFTRALTHRALLRLAFSPAMRNRSFLLSLPRLWLALGTGAMRYGIFVFEKPAEPVGAL